MSTLRKSDQLFSCNNDACRAHFPIVDGVPVLINENNSLYSIKECVRSKTAFVNVNRKRTVKEFLPSISCNILAKKNYLQFLHLLAKESPKSRVLVIGGCVLGEGIEVLVNDPHIELVETDVFFGQRTVLIADAHDIPFEDESFDGVIIQAVLEHTVDPYRCVDEIYRVLRQNAIVYAETPFIQQVHMGCYDFYRFTHLGHRRLFRKFEEIDSGAVCGPGMALAWSYRYFLLSFAESRVLRRLLSYFASLTSFFLKYVDYYLIRKAGTIDAASAFFFFGRKKGPTLSDQMLLKLYRGAC
jgi:SAM-dependent methyltransferase